MQPRGAPAAPRENCGAGEYFVRLRAAGVPGRWVGYRGVERLVWEGGGDVGEGCVLGCMGVWVARCEEQGSDEVVV